ncbi:DUF4350 domain-containing protein [Budvicia diplopodorum]|uniref:DUF4350 domain-containing protein n=1 Tax=Budvicia diplopodorum TaxID=1119056 RepID=UPI00135A5066|nr:DUF4350 domain-containing protein [Budvicia diplopodorum]
MNHNAKVAIIVGAILALCLSLILYQKLNWVKETVTIPPSIKVTGNSYYTAEQLLLKSDYQTNRINDVLALDKLPEKSTLILFNTALLKEPTQKTKLLNWVKTGGHLVLSPREDSNSIQLQEQFEIYVDDEYDSNDDEDDEKQEQSKAKEREPDAKSENRDALAISFERDNLRADVSNTTRFYLNTEVIKVTESVTDLKDKDLDVISRFSFEKGWVTVVPLELFTNASIKRYDHAKLWLHIATLPDRKDTIYLIQYITFPNLVSWLIEHALFSLLALGLCILLVLWRYVPRFGPLIPTSPPVRPSLTEHLHAVAEFHLQNRDYIRLITPLREEIARLLPPLRIHHPGINNVPQLVAKITHYDIALVTQALEAEEQQLTEFTPCVQTLCLLIDRLNSLQSSTSRRLNYGI